MDELRIRRLLSYFIDWYIITLLLDGIIQIYSLMEKGMISVTTLDSFNLNTALSLFVVMFGVNLLYFVILPYYSGGSTIGKKLLKIKDNK